MAISVITILSPLNPPLVEPFKVIVSSVAPAVNPKTTAKVSLTTMEFPAITSEELATFIIAPTEVMVVPITNSNLSPVPEAAGRVMVVPSALLIVTILPLWADPVTVRVAAVKFTLPLSNFENG